MDFYPLSVLPMANIPYLRIFSNVLVWFGFPELQEPVTDKLEEAAVHSSVALPSNPVEIEIETPEQRKKRERR